MMLGVILQAMAGMGWRTSDWSKPPEDDRDCVTEIEREAEAVGKAIVDWDWHVVCLPCRRDYAAAEGDGERLLIYPQGGASDRCAPASCRS